MEVPIHLPCNYRMIREILPSFGSKTSFFTKIHIFGSRKKKFLVNLKDENSWRFSLKSKDYFKSTRGEYRVEVLDSDFK